tara:strand:+ start:103 stop:282 length:180 start_codon:yes stop_codon:yes gene_type:complete
MEVISIKIPEIINHKIIEILELLTPTKVSSNASLIKYKIIPLYKVKSKNAKMLKLKLIV